MDIIRKPDSYQRATSHLDHKDYKKTSDLMKEIESRSNGHNNQVSDFIGSVESNIKKVFAIDVSSGITSDFAECKEPQQDSCYSIIHILKYYEQEATYPHRELRICKEPGTVRFQILLEDTYINPLAISTDEKQLQNIKKKLEGELKNNIVHSLKDFLKEGRDICNLYNDKFVPEVKKLVVEINEEGTLKGGCGLSYCPINK